MEASGALPTVLFMKYIVNLISKIRLPHPEYLIYGLTLIIFSNILFRTFPIKITIVQERRKSFNVEVSEIAIYSMPQLEIGSSVSVDPISVKIDSSAFDPIHMEIRN